MATSLCVENHETADDDRENAEHAERMEHAEDLIIERLKSVRSDGLISTEPAGVRSFAMVATPPALIVDYYGLS
jgi:hypothetical protein